MEREWFGFREWGKRQHYRDRRPPWIKSYTDRLNDYEFCALPDSAKGQLFCLELLAALHDNVVPADTRWLAQQIGSRDPIDLQLLKPFIRFVRAGDQHTASKKLASGLHPAALETEEERKTEKKIKRLQATEYPAWFTRFWQEYPIKKNKYAAYAEFSNLWAEGGGEGFFHNVLEALQTQVKKWRSDPSALAFPHPAKWLADRRFEDEI